MASLGETGKCAPEQLLCGHQSLSLIGDQNRIFGFRNHKKKIWPFFFQKIFHKAYKLKKKLTKKQLLKLLNLIVYEYALCFPSRKTFFFQYHIISNQDEKETVSV